MRLACFVWTVLKNVVLSEHQTYHAYFQQLRFGKLQEGLVFFFPLCRFRSKVYKSGRCEKLGLQLSHSCIADSKAFQSLPSCQGAGKVFVCDTFTDIFWGKLCQCQHMLFSIFSCHACDLYHAEIFICFSVDKIHPGPFATNYLQNINPQTAGCWLMLAQTLAAGAEKNNWVDCSKSTEISIS